MRCNNSSRLLLLSSFILLVLGCKPKLSAPAENNIVLDSLTRADKNPYVTYDQSPMDMSYYPVNYPLLKMNKQDSLELAVRVIYSRPHKKNRKIFSNDPASICQFGKEWRLGANEATEIEFFKNVTINGKNISKGSYVIYCVPQRDKWTIVLNSNLHTWGLHMDTTKDVLRTEIPAQVQSPQLEDFTMVFTDSPEGADLVMAWDNVKAVLPLTFLK